MFKLTCTQSGMRILTVKAAGCYANVSFGKAGKRRAEPRRTAKTFDLFGLAACATFAAALALTSINPRTELLARMNDGNVYVAGSGDDCADAFKDAVIPAGWRELTCVQVYL